ncbi:Arc family DNA-binding protein [Variovorax paradoxus]|uniref:Arc family DNA-binding protein n=1 Tax=Variovorax paradoxus TaxID=34073 RepID=UPI003D64DC7C
MKQTDPQFKIRLTPELKERLEKAAGDTRTISAEIIDRLQKSFEPHPAEERVMDLRNTVLAQSALIALQAGFITQYARKAPPGSAEAKFGETVERYFGANLTEKSAAGLPYKKDAEQAETMRKLAGLGAELRSSDMESDSVRKALGNFVANNPDLIPSDAEMVAKKTAAKKAAAPKKRPSKPKA